MSDVRPFKPIFYSCQDTKGTRQQVVAHNSVLDGLKAGKKVVHTDTCPDGKPTS